MARHKEYQPTYDTNEPSPLERKLWIGFLLAPLAWIIALMIGYPMAARVCGTTGILLTGGLTVLTAAAAAAGTLVAWRLRGRVDDPDLEGKRRAGRRSLMAVGSTILGVLMTTIIIGHGIAMLFLRPC